MGKPRIYLLTYVLILGVFILLAGCSQYGVQKLASKYVDEAIYGVSPSTYIINISLKNTAAPLCRVYYCQNKTSGSFFFADTSLIGGNCSYVDVDPLNKSDIEKVTDMQKDDSTFIQNLGLGQGPTFADFNTAMEYCANSYKYAVQVIEGNNKSYLDFPLEGFQASCTLEANIMPIYILYNKERDSDGRGTPPTDGASGVAEKFKGVGPVIVATEALPRKDSNTYSEVRKEAIDIKNACSNCKVFLSISLDEVYGNDSQALARFGINQSVGNKRYYLDKLKGDRVLLNTIDGIAFGIDSRYSEECSGKGIMAEEAIPLINYIRVAFQKPTIIYYTYLNDTPKCKYGDSDYSGVYESFFLAAPSLASAGLMAFVPQAFYESSSPFPECNNCAFTKKEFGQLKEAQKRFGKWFEMCKAYNINETPRQLIMEIGNGGSCQTIEAGTPYTPIIISDESALQTTLSTSSKPFLKCSTCLDFTEPTGVLKANINRVALPGNACDITSTAYAAANKFGVDGVVARAVAMAKSKGDNCYVKMLPSGGVKADDYDVAYTQAGCGILKRTYGSSCTENGQGNECKVVGAGLYGFAYKPGYAYNPSSMPAEVKKCGGNKFNPFNVDDATCIFAEKFKKALRNSQIVAQGGKTGSELRQTMGLLISFEVAGGDSQRAFSTFESLKNSGGDCNKMNGDAVAMCCEYKRTQNGAGYVFMPNRVGCSAQDIGSFMSAFASRHGKHDAYAASSYYATLYSKCEDCYLGSWKKNVCDEAKAVGITLPEC